MDTEKKQRRRKSKQAKDEPAEEPLIEQSPVQEAQEKNAYTEIVQKRIRNLQKRKQRLDKYEEQAATPDAAKLNQDQLLALKSKDQVIYPLKELEELTKSFKSLDEEYKSQKAKETQARAIELREAVEKAKKEVRDEELEKIRVLVKFLHVASWKRQFAPSQDENAAFESLLSLIYLGDESSVEAVEKLGAGLEEKVDDDSEFTFSQIKQLSLVSLDDLYAKAQDNDVEEPVVVKVNEEDSEEPISSVIKIPRGGLSFLNESELDVETEATAEDVMPPPQTIADEFIPHTTDYDPPVATSVDDAHANSAGANDWDDKTDGPATETLVAAEPVWEQADAPEKPELVSLSSIQKSQRFKSQRGDRNKRGYYRGRGRQNQQSGPQIIA